MSREVVALTSQVPSHSINLSRPRPRAQSNDTHDAYENFTTSLQQRQQQAHAYLHATQDISRPSSSSGSVPHTLRRTPRFDEPRRARQRSASLDSLTRAQGDPSAGAEPASPSRRATSAHPQGRTPHPALRISRRTASAILYALEEAIRTPYPFTPDLVEENAQMSDLGGGGNGRGSNGGARAAAGPVPVPQSSTGGLRTPRDIMKDREAREARRLAEAEQVQAQARRQQEEERRRSAERRAAAAGVAGSTRDSGGSQRRSQASAGAPPQQTPARQGERLSGGGRPASGTQQVDPSLVIGQSQSEPRVSSSRTRGATVSQAQPQPRVATEPATARRSQPTQPGLRPVSAAASTTQAAAGSSAVPQRDGGAEQPQQRSNVSSFPHAFERWEQLSSHWEGLTSYWLHKLESNQSEIGRNIPSASAMSRQITDLSAAGANLFHAVVELQRLRASSERKFQRWFFETRTEQERARELQGELEQLLQAERAGRIEAEASRTRAEQEKRNAERMVGEMRRELAISKDEARRAWEELGRREQEERDRTTSLREGMPTVVGGVQVVPMHTGAGLSRQDSESQRPTTREGAQYPAAPSAGQGQDPPYYEEGQSPTDTDPFTESGHRGPGPVLHHEPDMPSLAAGTYQPYPLGSTPATTSASVQTAIPPAQQQQSEDQPYVPQQPTRAAPIPTAVQQAIPSSQQQPPMSQAAGQPTFYQQPPEQTFLHSRESSTSAPGPEQPATSQPQELRSEPSYVSTTSEGETEEEIDSSGNLRRDAQGRPIVFHPSVTRRQGARSEESDDYDVEADVAREHELAARYGASPQRLVPATSAEAMAGYPVSSGAAGTQAGPGYSYGSRPSYSGEGYSGWEAVQTTRHHHPTRLSDVLEEDERSRTTGD